MFNSWRLSCRDAGVPSWRLVLGGITLRRVASGEDEEGGRRCHGGVFANLEGEVREYWMAHPMSSIPCSARARNLHPLRRVARLILSTRSTFPPSRLQRCVWRRARLLLWSSSRRERRAVLLQFWARVCPGLRQDRTQARGVAGGSDRLGGCLGEAERHDGQRKRSGAG